MGKKSEFTHQSGSRGSITARDRANLDIRRRQLMGQRLQEEYNQRVREAEVQYAQSIG
jgi:hypothetical protein